jgi:hypothetical protein
MEHRNPLSQHAVDSVRLHGKAHVHALELMNLVTMNEEDQIAEMTLHVGYAAVKGSRVALSEVREGRGSMRDDTEVVLRLPLHAPTVGAHARRLREWHAEIEAEASESIAELAVFICPRGSYYRSMETRFNEHYIEGFRNQVLAKCGVPFDEYHLDDFETVCDRYRAWVFIDAPEITDAQWQRMQAEPTRCFFATVNQAQVTAESFANFLKHVGVHRWCPWGNTLFASRRLLVLAMHTSGTHVTRFPEISDVQDALSGEILAQSTSEISIDTDRDRDVRLLMYRSVRGTAS